MPHVEWDDNDNLVRRAIAAYFRSPGDPRESLDQPSNTSDVRKVKGKSYVVLVNSQRTLAVYRVRPDGILKRMKRWPAALDK
jgi:hypothetical protein